MKDIYGGNDNERRAKEEILRGQFDQMKMREDENIAKYVDRNKASVTTIKVAGGTIEYVIVICKVLRTLLPIYTIRVFAIQQMRCDPNTNITLNPLVGR